MNFIRKYWKLLFMAGLILIGIVAYLNYFSWLKWGLGCQPDPWPEVVTDTWTKPLQEAGFKPARPEKPENIPGDKQPPAGEPILHGTGAVEETGEVVELVGVQTPDGKRWLTGWVDGRRVVFDRLDWSELPRHNDHSDLHLLIESAWVGDSPDFGVGVAWEPVHVLGADMGPALTMDLNRDIGQAPDWIALSGRLSRSFGPLSIGGDAGYRIGEDPGLHLGVSAGLTIAL
jgi:hypothetical protein